MIHIILKPHFLRNIFLECSVTVFMDYWIYTKFWDNLSTPYHTSPKIWTTLFFTTLDLWANSAED